MEFSDVVLSDYANQKICDIYDSCRNQCKSKYDCLLVDMISSSQNDRENCLRKSAVRSEYLDAETLSMLKDAGLITFIDSSSLAITAKGILYVELFREVPAIDNLISAIQAKYFITSQNTPISPKGRIILLSMVALRCFSSSCSIDVRSRKDVRDEWWEIFIKASSYLVSLGVIDEKNSLSNYKSKSEIEDKTSDVIRHTDKLPRQTEGIFSKSGSNQYWIEVSTADGRINTKLLALVIKKIFGNLINSNNYQDMANWCNALCLDEGYNVESSFINNGYLSCAYDDEITNAFEAASLIKS